MSDDGYGAKIDSLFVGTACDGIADFTKRDLLALALAAADQAGVSIADYKVLTRLLSPRCPTCGDQVDGYQPTAASLKVAPVNDQCERCHDADVSRIKRRRLRDLADGHGDYLRDQQKDER